MRTAAAAIVLLLIAHVFLVTAGGLWLAATDRLSGERLTAVVDVFRETNAAQAKREAEAAAAEQAALEVQADLARMEDVSDGPQRLEDRLRERLESDDFAMHRLERMKQESSSVIQRLAQDRAYVQAELARLDREREAFAAEVAGREAALADADFRRAVETLEQLKPKQAKAVVQELVAGGDRDQAVAYLAAMDLRKSAGVLKQFKGDVEAAEAAVLIEAIRRRQSDDLNQQLAEAAQP